MLYTEIPTPLCWQSVPPSPENHPSPAMKSLYRVPCGKACKDPRDGIYQTGSLDMAPTRFANRIKPGHRGHTEPCPRVSYRKTDLQRKNETRTLPTWPLRSAGFVSTKVHVYAIQNADDLLIRRGLHCGFNVGSLSMRDSVLLFIECYYTPDLICDTPPGAPPFALGPLTAAHLHATGST